MPDNMSSRKFSHLLRTLLIILGSATALVILGGAQLEPEFLPLSPADGSVDVHPGRALKIRITGPAMHNGITVSLQNRQDGDVPIAVDFDPSEELIIVKPRNLLKPSTAYALCVSRRFSSPFDHVLWGWRGDNNCLSFTTRGIQNVQTRPSAAAGLIVTANNRPFASYYDEILKAEGLNLFDTIPEDRFDPVTLSRYSVVLLATSTLSSANTAALESWVQAGGSLIATRPGNSILALMCLVDTETPLRRAYLQARPGLAATEKFADRPLQLHGEIDRYESLPGCKAETTMVAQLHETPDRPLPAAAITMRRLGHGTITALSYDLARSIAYTRQGNPDWADQERDGSAPRRPNDLFYPDHLDRALIGIPQADEHQRLLANLVLTTAPIPLPRFWYLPGNRRAAIVMVGDDHAIQDGTANFFAKLRDESTAGCWLERWECLRATALLTPRTEIPPAVVEAFHSQGFEFGAHVDTNCANQDAARLERTLSKQMRDFRTKYPFLGDQVTHRLHCIVWNGWTEAAQTQNNVGIRFDLNYYNWPPVWLDGRSGFMTGSGMPMPFVTEDGKVLDIYQAATQLVNEDRAPQMEGVQSMIARALGPDQFFSAFVAHYDFSDDYANILVKVAREHGVALISAEQMLTWVAARNASRFASIRWNNGILHFGQQLAEGAEHAYVLLPMQAGAGRLMRLECGGQVTDFAIQTVKGLPVAAFPARADVCEAHYAHDAS